jgi:hypothetical protein
MNGTTEHFLISTGRALVGPLTEPVELGPGDYIAYPGAIPHLFQALEIADGEGVCRLQRDRWPVIPSSSPSDPQILPGW